VIVIVFLLESAGEVQELLRKAKEDMMKAEAAAATPSA
jgi:hypothetical protein